MKLLKPELCLCRSGGGNVKTQATLVEGQGTGFWTGVRFPSGPLKFHSTDKSVTSCIFPTVTDLFLYGGGGTVKNFR